MTNDVFCEPEGVYIVFVGSRLWIPTPGFHQSSHGESGKYSCPVCLSVWFVRGGYGLSVRGLRLVLIAPCLVGKKMILIPSQVRMLIQTSWYGLRPVGKM